MNPFNIQLQEEYKQLGPMIEYWDRTVYNEDCKLIFCSYKNKSIIIRFIPIWKNKTKGKYIGSCLLYDTKAHYDVRYGLYISYL